MGEASSPFLRFPSQASAAVEFGIADRLASKLHHHQKLLRFLVSLRLRTMACMDRDLRWVQCRAGAQVNHLRTSRVCTASGGHLDSVPDNLGGTQEAKKRPTRADQAPWPRQPLKSVGRLTTCRGREDLPILSRLCNPRSIYAEKHSAGCIGIEPAISEALQCPRDGLVVLFLLALPVGTPKKFCSLTLASGRLR